MYVLRMSAVDQYPTDHRSNVHHCTQRQRDIVIITMSARCCFFFFFNDTATTEIYTLSLHDALPIWTFEKSKGDIRAVMTTMIYSPEFWSRTAFRAKVKRSEEHTSELQSRQYLVCRLLLEKKKKCWTS